MSDRLAIELPAEIPQQQRDELLRSLQGLDEVEQADVLASRSIDPATITIGIKLVSALGPVMDKLLDTLRGSRIKGLKLTLPGGTSISVDEISGKDLQQLLVQLGH
jgi:hypothetical protein